MPLVLQWERCYKDINADVCIYVFIWINKSGSAGLRKKKLVGYGGLQPDLREWLWHSTSKWSNTLLWTHRSSPVVTQSTWDALAMLSNVEVSSGTWLGLASCSGVLGGGCSGWVKHCTYGQKWKWILLFSLLPLKAFKFQCFQFLQIFVSLTATMHAKVRFALLRRLSMSTLICLNPKGLLG